MPRFTEIRESCRELVSLPMVRRPANALNVEPIQPMDRCRLREPASWNGADPRAARWLLSGGSAMVLGVCSAIGCPRAARVELGYEDAVEACADAFARGLVLTAYDSTDETTHTAGPFFPAVGPHVWAIYGYRPGGGFDVFEGPSSPERLARKFVYLPGVGKYRGIVAARAALHRAGFDGIAKAPVPAPVSVTA